MTDEERIKLLGQAIAGVTTAEVVRLVHMALGTRPLLLLFAMYFGRLLTKEEQVKVIDYWRILPKK